MTHQFDSALIADVEAFCDEVRPSEELAYMEHRFNDEAIPLAKKYNLLGMKIPKDLGGRGTDLRSYLQAHVIIGREGTGLRTLFSAHSSIGQNPILEWGNIDQKKRYLTPSARGEKIMAFALTEPDAGSNPLEMTSTYRRENGRYLLNGVKYLISNGGIADAMVTFAYNESEPRKISAFIIDTNVGGLEREDLTAKLGLPTSNTAMFEMRNLPVPLENMLGEEGNGFRIAMSTLLSGRLSVAAGCLGVIEDCLKESLEYARIRSQHGRPIGKHQLVQEHIAEIELARQATESLLDTAAEAKEAADADKQNRELHARADMLSAQLKLFASNAACEAADRAVQILGGRGYSELYRPGRHWKDVRVCRIYEGTDEVLKLKIAFALLGKEFAAYR